MLYSTEIKDIHDIKDGIEYIRSIATYANSTDDILEYITHEFDAHIREGGSVQHIYEWFNRYKGTGGPEEYTATTLWGCAKHCIQKHKRMRRSCACGCPECIIL